MHQRIMQGTLVTFLGMFLVLGGLTSCSDTTGPAGGGSGTGTLRVNLVDAPTQLQNVESLEVVFERVIVHRSSDADPDQGGWFTVLSDTLAVENRTFDLLQLVNGVFATLGEVELEAGYYTQMRIMLESATLVVNGEIRPLFIPSGYQTGIKLVDGFTIDPDVITEITLDFDVAQSLREVPPGSGNYIMRPTIRMIQAALSGTISGTVTPIGIGALLLALNPADGDTVTTTLADPATGEYVLQALPAGTYDVRAEAVGYEDSTRTGITVTAGADTPDVDFELVPSGD